MRSRSRTPPRPSVAVVGTTWQVVQAAVTPSGATILWLRGQDAELVRTRLELVLIDCRDIDEPQGHVPADAPASSSSA